MVYNSKPIFTLPKIIRSTLFMVCILSAVLTAEEQEKQLSFEIYPKWFSNDNYTLQGNIGIDKVFQHNDWTQYFAKPSGTLAIGNNWALHGGLGLYYRDNKIIADRSEIRPFVGVSHHTDIAEKWTTSFYLRAEERYYSYNSDKDSANHSRVRLRLRAAHTFDSHSLLSYWNKFTAGAELFKSENTDQDLTVDNLRYDYETRVVLGLERYLQNKNKIRYELAWKYKSLPDKLIDSAVNTVYFKIKYYPVWGDILGNRLYHREVEE